MLKLIRKSPVTKSIARKVKRFANTSIVSLYRDVEYDRSKLFPRIMIDGEQLLADQAIQKMVRDFQFNTVLDVGSGKGHHAAFFSKNGKDVTKIDYGKSENFNDQDSKAIVADYLTYKFDKQFDALWCSHILEHQLNVNVFLKKVFNDLEDGGVLGITVPPMKHEIVGGHVSLWNGGYLIYNLALAGFDCSKAIFLKYDYNLSVIVTKRKFDLPELSFDTGDITQLKPFLPAVMHENCFGDFDEINWF